MSNILIPFTKSTKLTDYLPVPRQLLNLELPSTAVLLYALLLDRATLSQKNKMCSSNGEIYVIFTVEHLADKLHLCPASIKNNLRILSNAGLIRRERPVKNGVNNIYLYIPFVSNVTVGQGESNSLDGENTSSRTGKIIDNNNRNNQRNKIDNYYNYNAGDSL